MIKILLIVLLFILTACIKQDPIPEPQKEIIQEAPAIVQEIIQPEVVVPKTNIIKDETKPTEKAKSTEITTKTESTDEMTQEIDALIDDLININ